MRRETARRERAKGKGKGKGQGKANTQSQPMTRYEGTDTACSICQQDFQREEMLFRSTCNHLFHEACWDDYLSRSTDDV